ncbi:MAG: PQQ-binding-like beta-propeller repeat protein, partial [Planctomycetes bacterium]|nr:PQQ-binding-like beta-propeller repeat protein [Planctomycetota bacterium]
MVHPHPTPAGARSLGTVLLLAGCTLTFSIAPAAADGWPTYRHDIARSGVSSETMPVPLIESWVYRSAHAPRPAWDDPPAKPLGGKGFRELRRMHFDDVFQVVAADGAVYFGSSVDNKVYSLDAATGAVRWTCFTGGPIRLAPTVAGGRVFVGSDDGHAYCLDASDGSIVWQRRAAPEDRRVLGHGKMISLWPSRTGVLVDDGVAYFGAGIFPGEGVFLHAVDAADGSQIWLSDGCGEPPQSRVSPQGYLLASKTRLFAPMGRVSPAAFDRGSGRLLHETYFGHHVGGAYALLAGDEIYTGTEEIAAYNSETQAVVANFAGQKMVVSGETAYLAGPQQLVALDRKTRSPRWKTDCPCNQELILAGKLLFAGGDGKVVAVDAESGRLLWTGDVEGTAKGLAVAEGRLLVSTDRGRIHAFGPAGAPQHGPMEATVDDDPYRDSPLGPMFERAAQSILEKSQVRRGYALVLGCSTGQLALELAKRSELMIYVVEPNAEKAAAARRALDAAGVYGARVCVDEWPLDAVPY